MMGLKVGFIGLGAMGSGMAANLSNAGVLEVVYNRTQSRAEDFARAYPVLIASSIAGLAEDCEVVFTCVSRDEDLLEVANEIADGIKPETVVVDTSTVSHSTAKQVAKSLAAKGACFLDAPVSGGTEGAKNGTLAMMVGGDASVLDRVALLLKHIATKIVHMGDVGTGQATKAVNQIMAAGINHAVTEALAFAEAEQLPISKVIDVVGSGAAGNWFLNHRGASMVAGTYAPGFKLGLHHKDLGICKAMVAEHDVQLPVIEMSLILYQRLIDQGFSDEDISCLYRHKREMFVEPGH